MKSAVITLFLSIVLLFGARSQSFYDLYNVSTVEITFANTNWNTILDIFYAEGMGERLMADVVIDGELYDSVGVRFKGGTTYSTSNAKNPLNIEIDYLKNQRHDGYTTLKLSNGKNDPSFVREILGYELASKYMTVADANYCKVYINGSFYGVFTNIENVNGEFANRFLSSRTEDVRFKCSPLTDIDNGSSLEYFGTDTTLYYDYYDMKSDSGWTELVELIYTISFEPDSIENKMDIDRAIWMLAFNNVMVNLNSYIGYYSDNYYLIKDRKGQFNTILWDLNECFGGFNHLEDESAVSINELIELDPFFRQGEPEYPLVNMILNNPTYKRMYLAHCKTLLDENITNSLYSEAAHYIKNFIDPVLQTDPNKLYSISTFRENIDTTVGSGSSETFGLTQLMDARGDFLKDNEWYTCSRPVISDISSTPESVGPNDQYAIRAKITNADSIYIAIRGSHKQVYTKHKMYDDGWHFDGAAGDNIYGFVDSTDYKDIQFYIYAENDSAGLFSPERAELQYHTVGVSQGLVINEIMPSNRTTAADAAGEYDDWIELYNNTSTAICLDGYRMTDNADSLDKWTFPYVMLEPDEYLIVWADKDTTQYGIHTNYRLSASGEKLMLLNPSGDLIYEVVYPILQSDLSFARYPNGTGGFIIKQPTFGSNNDEVVGIKEVPTNKREVQIFPNPTNGTIFIRLEEETEMTLRVFNMHGQCILQKSGIRSNDQIDISNLKTGLYYFKINNHNPIKIIKTG